MKRPTPVVEMDGGQRDHSLPGPFLSSQAGAGGGMGALNPSFHLPGAHSPLLGHLSMASRGVTVQPSLCCQRLVLLVLLQDEAHHGIAVSKHRLQELIQLRAAAVAAGDVTAGARHRCRGSAGGWWSLAGPRLECWMVE